MRPLPLVMLFISQVLPGCSSDSGTEASGPPADSGVAGDGGSGGSGGAGGSSGSGTAGEGGAPTGSCVSPPAPDFDPLDSFAWEPPPADYMVTSTADDGPGSLRGAIAAVGDGGVIAFNASLTGTTIQLASTLEVEKSLTIDGTGAPGVTLDAGKGHRIMTIGKAKVTTIAGIRFVGGSSATSGGAIHVGQTDPEQPDGSITVVGCRFERNEGGRGGAIRVGWRTKALIMDSTFVENDGTIGDEADRGFSGGAIATSQSAELVVKRCRFERNRGWNGGAIYNILQPVTVEDSVFIDNEGVSGGGGGAFFTDGGNPVGPDNDPDTGVDGTIALRRIWVQGTRGKGYGGALLLWGYPRDAITIESSVFLNNVCEEGDDGSAKGGAGRIHALAPMVIRDSVFADNRAVQQGGGLWIDGTGPFEITNSTFSGNVVDNDAGGGFNFNGSGSVTIESSLFAENRAGRACGAFWYGKKDLDIGVRNTIFAFNEAGQDIEQRHVGYRPRSDGGNLEYVDTEPNRGRVFEDSLFADPVLTKVEVHDGMPLRALAAGSPAIGAAMVPAPERDARSAMRDQAPDIGPFELGASCD